MNNIQYVLKDKPLAAWSLDNAYLPSVYDSTGGGNDGEYVCSSMPAIELFPLLGGSSNAVLINSSSSIWMPALPIADKYTSGNSFSIEIWVFIKNNPLNSISIFSSNVELLSENKTLEIAYRDNAIYFNIDDQFVVGSVPDSNRVLHLVATYNNEFASIYINGRLAGRTALNGFSFSQANDGNTRFLVGPTIGDSSFLIDDICIYRYELSDQQIFDHYMFPSTNSSEQISFVEQGILFPGTDSRTYKALEFSYPKDKKWTDFYVSEIEYNSADNSITLANGNSEAYIYDSFYILPSIGITSSKVEWDNSNGIEIYVSDTGEDNSYILCNNGHTLPKWTIGPDGLPESSTIYVKIKISSVDANLIKPKLKNLKFTFYSEKEFYSSNDGSYISIEEPQGSQVYTIRWDISASSISYPPFQRNSRAGYRPDLMAGFAINTDASVSSLEMIWHVGDKLENTLIFNEDSSTKYSWDNSGLEMTGIDSVYLNGIDITEIEDIRSVISNNELYHVVINLSEPATGKIFINSGIDSQGDWEKGGNQNSYSHIALYELGLSEDTILEHYSLYKQLTSVPVDTVSVPMTELGVYAYNNDWQVIKSV